ncbi:hsp90 co-chaperone Aha1p [[Candida] jaroonii]|uniref:Hsp90 co-chaperone Aha1p n=1 Tax=[Candida] jaroonii TaxID=467808 RepID=A0ACA9Y0K4_9ASCO|nr:hsp90 co-chaperone Aha1p [[Candida] jaroonii]
MVVNNPNNWHWVDKNCLSWSKDYFKSKTVGLKAEKAEKSVAVESVSSVEGDCEVSQRKGKVISLFDLKIVLKFEGKVKDEDVSGSITIPELAYDTESDEIQFDISVYNENSTKDEIRPLIKSEILPKLRDILSKFGSDLIETNSSDIQLESDKVNSVFTKANQEQQKKGLKSDKPTPKATTSTTSSTSASTSKSTKPVSSNNVPKYNTSTLHLEPTFNTTSEQLYITLLDPQRIAAWSRSPPLIEPLPAKSGSNFKFFGGSINGKFTKLVENEQIVQDWRLEDWKDGHFAKLDISLNQGSSETKMVVKFSGIPIGEEDRVRNNFEDYYIKSIKITFGFGAVL